MKNVESFYPLSPLQEGMLFHSIHALESSDEYFRQVSFAVEGSLEGPAFLAAWKKVLERHSVLRTSFVAGDVRNPVQVVHADVSLPCEEQDWSDIPQAEQCARLQEFLAADQARKFDLSKPPLMRCALFRGGERLHYFVWSFHHIILDGWSLPIVFAEVLKIYRSLREGSAFDLSAPRPYRDYIVWLKQQSLVHSEEFWRKYLADFTGPTPFGIDRNLNERGYGEERLELSADVSEKAKIFVRSRQLTLNTLAQAAWALLLARYSSESDVVFGNVVSGRPAAIPGIESMVGMFINTLPLRVSVPVDAELLPWLNALQANQTEARQYEFTPLMQIQKWLRRPQKQALFESLVVFENYPAAETFHTAGELSIRDIRSFERTSYPLTLTVTAGRQISFLLSYDKSRFDGPSILRMLGHLETILKSILENPRTLADIPLLSGPEEEQILQVFNATNRNYDLETPIHQLIESQARLTPDALALTCEDSTLTYKELNCRANQLAHRLRSLGISKGSLVGICMERSIEMVVALLGVLKSGGAYLPLDAEYPKERLAFMLEDSRTPVLLTQERLAPALPKHSAHTIALDVVGPEQESESQDNPLPAAGPDDLAYVIYTSGSTGKPKGAMNNHRGLCNRLLWMQEMYQLNAGDSVLQKTPFSFDVSVWEFFWPLFTGARLVMARPGGHQDCRYLADIIQREKITTLHFVPSMLQLFLQEPGIEGCSSVRRVICSGEALPFELQERFFARIPAELHNLYGPTEAAIDVTYWQCRPDSPERTVPIGRPIANIRIYILDPSLRPVPVGVPGELYIGGVGVGRGYLNRPELTAEKFIPDPFCSDSNARLYRTGDLAVWRPDGNIEYLGRTDHQVKIHGLRIELGEIENALTQIAGVSQATVVAREDAGGDKKLVAYLVAQRGCVLGLSELRQSLKTTLPEYMVPGVFVMLDEMPLSPNGKVDRRALPAPDDMKLGIKNEYVAPRTEAEQILAHIWAEVLRVERVGVYDNFFELGGDSILSIQIASRANHAGLRLTTRLLFEKPTVAELACAAQPKSSARESQSDYPAVGPVPLTPVQHWFFENDPADPQHFNQALLLAARRPLDAGALEDVFGKLIEHHDALRLRMHREGDSWRQEITGHVPQRVLEQHDLSRLPAELQSAQIEKTAAELQSSLNLSTGPTLRAAFFRCHPQGHDRLLVVVHHFAVDGVSWRILLEDLQHFYTQALRRESIKLPEKTTSFRQWSESLVACAPAAKWEQEIGYWEGVVETRAGMLPLDIPEGINSVASARTLTLRLSVEETRALLQEVPARYRTQVNDVLLAALTKTLIGWTGGGTIRVDLEGHGREEIGEDLDLTRSVGWFTSVYPIVLTLDPRDEPEEALKSVKEQLRKIPNRGIGYGLLRYLHPDAAIRKKLQPARPAEVLFNYLGQFDHALSSDSVFGLAAESVGPSQSPRARRRYPLEINASVAEGALHVYWTFSQCLHKQETMQQLAEAYLHTLRQTIACCLESTGGFTPSDFPLTKLTQPQIDGMVRQFGLRIEDAYPLSPMQRGMLFHSLYESDAGAYIEQVSCELKGSLGCDVFERAWQHTLRKHSVLRAFFLWQGLTEPVQVIPESVALRITQLDWRELSPAAQQVGLDEYQQADRTRGFDLASPPLMRLTLVQLGEDRFQFIWTWSHLLMDGWCLPIVVEDVFAAYKTFTQGANVAVMKSANFADYVAWLATRDHGNAESFWRKFLAGFSTPTPLPFAKPGSQSQSPENHEYAEVRLGFDADFTGRLQSFARSHQLTINTLVQGAWALLLGRLTGERDVVFGATLSGRPAELPGIENMVGVFINTLPMRVQIAPDQGLIAFLRDIQSRQLELHEYEYSPLYDVKQWSEVPAAMPLFESILVFENYPVDESLGGAREQLDIVNTRLFERTNYPLNVVAVPGRELQLAVLYDGCRFEQLSVHRMLQRMEVLIKGMVANPHASIVELPLQTAEEREQVVVGWNRNGSDYGREQTVQALFEEQVARSPEAEAVVYGEEKISYGELNRR
ncbi:MAG TPA: amino acid adenylation domain-containing protein, partial [Terriglobales bacterium]|nr:amino acid adenylation domain-containing protein [Terriglobales bacterium]